MFFVIQVVLVLTLQATLIKADLAHLALVYLFHMYIFSALIYIRM